MASKTCASCLRTFQRQSIIPQVWRNLSKKETKSNFPPKTRRTASRFTSRSFATTSIRCAEPEYNVPPTSSIPPVTPYRAERNSKSTSSTPTKKAAQELRKFAGRGIETYTAYGATEILYKECARQADYSIPAAKDQEAEIPKTDDGEDLGVGEGWWHTGTLVEENSRTRANETQNWA